MKKIAFSQGWNLSKGMFPMPGGSEKVDLPYDYCVTVPRDPGSPGGGPFGYFQGATLRFSKTFVPDPAWQGSHVELEFEAVYKDAAVYLNGMLIRRHPYGYTGFYIDITDILRWDQENTVEVQVYNEDLPNTRWYSGTGITRPVWLIVSPRAHIAPDGIFVKPADISEDACTLEVETTAAGIPDAKEYTVLHRVLDAAGNVVKAYPPCTVMSGETVSCQKLPLASPELWSPEHPYLYRLRTVLACDGTEDVVETPFGVRSVRVSPDRGLELNNKTIKLKGGCVHSENGILGARSFAHGEEWKVRKLLEQGYNAVRCAHNPPARSFLDACDRLGLLVLDEAFDVWADSKNPADYGRYFAGWWDQDLSAMLKRDRNHPSVIMWSIGNEVKELTGTADGFRLSETLAKFVKRMDGSRPVTSALQEVYLGPTAKEVPAFDLLVPDEIWQDCSEKFSKELDVVGYNYGRYHYETDGKVFPDRVICGEESFALKAYENWRDVEQYSYVIGDFVWTALDYLGEAGCGFVSYISEAKGMEGMMQMMGAHYPYHLATTGDMDVCGVKRPQSYYRDCVWHRTDIPYIGVYDPKDYGKTLKMSCWGWHPVSDCWTWPGQENRYTMADVYSTADEVSLYVGDTLVETKKKDMEDMKYLFRFEKVTYVPGTITAVAVTGGKEVGRQTLRTEGSPAELRLTCDRANLPCTYGETAYIDMALLDENGTVIRTRDADAEVTVSGPARLIALGSADPNSEELYTQNHRKSYLGRLQGVICADGTAGEEITVTVSMSGLRAVCRIPCKA